MSDNIKSTASSVDISLATSQAGMPSYVQALNGKPSNLEGMEPNRTDEAKASVVNPLGDFTLQFQVDEKTNDITVYILDRESQVVVRTIPPEKLSNLNPGDLLQLFA